MHKLGIIVPFRNRYEHLNIFVTSIKNYFQNKNIQYQLIIVEQDDAKLFNRGMLLNIGFKEALAFSSNTFFYQVGVKTGPENIAKWGKELGIAGTINLDLLGLDGANPGQIPTPKEKEKL